MLKTVHKTTSLACIVALSFVTACDVRLPGKPTEAERWRAPADVSDFNQLYTTNCAGCHGADGKLGAARPLNDPLYLSFVTDNALKQAISLGRAGTNMPGFAETVGGVLTDRQIELLVSGMRAAWSRPNDFAGLQIPAYSASAAGDSASGAHAYQTYCASCHGPNGSGGPAGSIVDPNFLKLVSDQGLRTTVVVGRADLGKPDWRSNVSGHPMSSQEIDAVVAWLAAHREN